LTIGLNDEASEREAVAILSNKGDLFL